MEAVTRGKYAGSPKDWANAEHLLAEAQEGVEHERAPGEAAFYSPKIDIQFADSAGREWTLCTVQVGFHQPAQFGLQYLGPDARAHRPVLVHRSILGSLERVLAQLVEEHGGAFPLLLAPVQVVVFLVGDAESRPTRRWCCGAWTPAACRGRVRRPWQPRRASPCPPARAVPGCPRREGSRLGFDRGAPARRAAAGSVVCRGFPRCGDRAGGGSRRGPVASRGCVKC
ncbi:aminoacyl--tRNA ligase-related protein [Amycolatopsis sulphurea]|uniref:aminoacyl--tRNA ligase-related protein n=1 Tax=Amycolatopsis sulphurea TaxID=76022 RepID=UPI0026B74139